MDCCRFWEARRARRNRRRRGRRISRRMTSICEASPCPTMRLRTRKRSRCWSGRWGSIRAMRQRGKRWDRDIISTRPLADLAKIVRETEASVMMEPDAEAWYRVGALMAACGQNEPALRLLKAAVQQNYR